MPVTKPGGIMIFFNVPAYTGKEIEYIKQAVSDRKLSGNGNFTKKCNAFFKDAMKCPGVMMTTSCTHALEMSAMLAGIKTGDEVIMPSYTFTSTATAFALRGAKIVFVDIRKDTMNIDEKLIEAAVTERTRAIVPVHYAGVPCEMDEINRIAKKHGLLVIEDAAQAVLSTYRGKQAGTLGDIGCFSFHETKNFTCGEGGAIILNRAGFIEEAEIIWEKGTNRNKFFRGEVDKYTWVGLGSSYLMSELNAAYLWAQLEMADSITSDRMRSWNYYFNSLKPLSEKGLIELPQIPKECTHNGHMFYLKTKDLKERTALIAYLKDRGIMAIFHYIPLHSSPAGLKFGIFSGTDNFTTKESERLLRLPMYFGLSGDDAAYISGAVRDFYKA